MSRRRKIMKVIFSQEGQGFSLQEIVEQSNCKEEHVLEVISELIRDEYIINSGKHQYMFYNI